MFCQCSQVVKKIICSTRIMKLCSKILKEGGPKGVHSIDFKVKAPRFILKVNLEYRNNCQIYDVTNRLSFLVSIIKSGFPQSFLINLSRKSLSLLNKPSFYMYAISGPHCIFDSPVVLVDLQTLTEGFRASTIVVLSVAGVITGLITVILITCLGLPRDRRQKTQVT